MLYATVRNRKIHVKKPETVVQNGKNVDWLDVDMDDEWQEMETIICSFSNRRVEEENEVETVQEVPLTFGERVLVPTECLEHEGMLSVRFTGYVGGKQIMTTMMPDSFWAVVKNGPMSAEDALGPEDWPGWNKSQEV